MSNSKSIYPISENSLRSSFSLPIRINHRGTQARDRYSIRNLIECDAAKLLASRLSEDRSKVCKIFNKNSKHTPMTLAAYVDSQKCIKVLLSYGANIDGLDGNKRTALSVAIDRDNDELVEFLLKLGAKNKEL